MIIHDRPSAPSTVGELEAALLRRYPVATAEGWDRMGLLVGDPEAHLAGVACALDPTVEAVRAASERGANVLLTHHPAFLAPPERFGPLGLTPSTPGSVVYEAILRGVCLMNVHTALDASDDAFSMLPDLLGLHVFGALEPQEQVPGYGQMCWQPFEETAKTVCELAQVCKDALGGSPRVWGHGSDVPRILCTWTGSAGDALDACFENKVDLLICGELKYHSALEAMQRGLDIIEVGHDASELPFANVLAQACREAGLEDECVFVIEQRPYQTM